MQEGCVAVLSVSRRGELQADAVLASLVRRRPPSTTLVPAPPVSGSENTQVARGGLGIVLRIHTCSDGERTHLT